MENHKTKIVDTYEYISVLKELAEQGKEVSVLVSGDSMTPFLIHARDRVFFSAISDEIKRGDIVFYQRSNGKYVMHRVHSVRPDGYYIVGDAQYRIEGPIKRKQIFAKVIKAERNGKLIDEKSYIWKYYKTIWLSLRPIRRYMMALCSKLKNIIDNK